MKVASYYPTTIRIDNPDTGDVEDIKIRVKRFTLEEASKFMRDYYRSANPPSAALVARKPDGPEQEKRTVTLGGKTEEVYVVTDDEVLKRRLVEMDETERQAYEEMDAEESDFSDRFLAETVTKYVTVERDQLYEEGPDGTEKQITSGADLLRVYGGRKDIMAQLLRAVHYENTLSAPAKKALRLVSDSVRSSVERRKAADGLKQEPTADAAGTSASAGTEGAADPSQTPSSSSSDGRATATEGS